MSRGELGLTESVACLVVAVHATVITTVADAVWAFGPAAVVIATLAVLGLLGWRGPGAAVVRASTIAVLGFVLMALDDPASTYVVLWYYLLAAIYPVILPPRVARVFVVGLPVAFLALIPFGVEYLRAVTVLRAVTLLMIGVFVRGAAGALGAAVAERDRAAAVLDACLDASSVAFVVLDSDGLLLRWNQAVVRLQAVERDLRPGLPLGELGLPAVVVDVIDAAERNGGRGTAVVEASGRHWAVEAFGVHVAQRRVGFACLASDVTEQCQSEQRLAHLAAHDPLTGLANRTLFSERLTGLLRAGAPVAVLWCDVDYFKVLNDALGHVAGDGVLVEIAHRLVEVVGAVADVARIGGDEFAVLSHGGWDEAHLLAEAMCRALREPMHVDGRGVTATISVGVALARGHATVGGLLRDADVALYQAKELGRDRVAVFDDAARAALEQRLSVGEALRGAVERGEITVAFQPVVQVSDGRTVAFEALARWSAESGEVSPTVFIPLAEELGLIGRLGEQVLRTACRQLRDWRRDIDPELRIGVNVSPLQFDQPDLFAAVRDALDTFGLPPSALVLEVTESMLMRDLARTFDVLDKLREHGVQIALDDFGTGYSSLAYLRDLPVDTIKVDRSFTRRLPQDRAMFGQLIALAQVTGSSTVVEGVETREQWDAARAAGADLVQGFWVARPMPPADCAAWLVARSTR